jgi:hypothetical protein
MKPFSLPIHHRLTAVPEPDEWRCDMNALRPTASHRAIAAVAAAAVLGLSGVARAPAQEHRGRGDVGVREQDGWRGPAGQRWRHGDIWRFHETDLGRWRGGHWFHGDHFGRLGWWWIVDGAWFFYPTPVYPYPDPYIPPAVVTQAPPPQPTPQYLYYCASANGYYPYVMSCPEGWVAVAPQPPPQ